MSHRESTIQQVDPLGVLGARTFSVACAATIIVIAGVLTWTQRGQVVSWGAIVASLLSATIVAVCILITSSTGGGVVTRRLFQIAITAAASALAFFAAALAGRNEMVQDDWGSTVIAITILAFTPYRPGVELGAAGILMSLYTGFVVLLQHESFTSPVPIITLIIASATPIAAIATAGVVFQSTIIEAVREWRSRARASAAVVGQSVEDGIARTVQQDRVTILNRDVVPFLEQVIARGTITEGDRERARSISDSIRSVMVAEANRSWLESLVLGIRDSVLGPVELADHAIADDDRLSNHLAIDQRTGLRALLVELFSSRGFDSRAFSIEFTAASRDRVLVVLRASIDTPAIALRSRLAPLIAVVRVVFPVSAIEHSASTLTIRFFYERH